MVAGEGLHHPEQQPHLIKSHWLLPRTAPTLPGGFPFHLPCQAVPLWPWALPGQSSELPLIPPCKLLGTEAVFSPALGAPLHSSSVSLSWSVVPRTSHQRHTPHPTPSTNKAPEPTAWKALIQAMAAKHHLWASEEETELQMHMKAPEATVSQTNSSHQEGTGSPGCSIACL